MRPETPETRTALAACPHDWQPVAGARARYRCARCGIEGMKNLIDGHVRALSMAPRNVRQRAPTRRDAPNAQPYPAGRGHRRPDELDDLIESGDETRYRAPYAWKEKP